LNPFIAEDLYVSYIALAIYVAPYAGEAVHRNRPHHGLMLNDNGEKEYIFSDGRSYTVRRGEIFYLPKGTNYVVKTLQSGGCYAINFDLTTDTIYDPFVIHMANVKPVQELFRDAQRVWKTRHVGYHYRCTADLVQILAAIRAEAHSAYLPHNKAAAIRPAIEYIEEHYTQETIQIADLAKMCGISDVHFRNLFQRIYGNSPCKYIHDMKLSRARELLLSGEYSVHETALLCGYCDDGYFSREFKKSVGVSPRDFKKHLSEK